MATHIDPWLTNLQLSKTVFNSNSNLIKPSNVVGRKINNGSYTLKSKKPKNQYPNIVLLHQPITKRAEPTKNLYLSKIAGRSLSLNKIISKKYTDKDAKVFSPYNVKSI